MLIYITYVLRR